MACITYGKITYKNIVKHTVHTIVSWPNPKLTYDWVSHDICDMISYMLWYYMILWDLIKIHIVKYWNWPRLIISTLLNPGLQVNYHPVGILVITVIAVTAEVFLMTTKQEYIMTPRELNVVGLINKAEPWQLWPNFLPGKVDIWRASSSHDGPVRAVKAWPVFPFVFETHPAMDCHLTYQNQTFH